MLPCWMGGWWFGWQRLLPTVNTQEPLKAHDMRHSLATIEAQGRPAEVQACAAIRKAIDYLGLVRQPTQQPTIMASYSVPTDARPKLSLMPAVVVRPSVLFAWWSPTGALQDPPQGHGRHLHPARGHPALRVRHRVPR